MKTKRHNLSKIKDLNRRHRIIVNFVQYPNGEYKKPAEKKEEKGCVCVPHRTSQTLMF